MNITNINKDSTIEQQKLPKSTSIMALPNEMIENIIVYLDIPEIAEKRHICKRFSQVIDDDKGILSLTKKTYEYKKLYSQSPKATNNIAINGYKQRFNQWLKSLSITKLQYSMHIINKYKIHGQYYYLARLLSYDNKYTFNECQQIKADECFKNERRYKQRFFYDFHVTHDQNIYFIITNEASIVLVNMLDNTVEELSKPISFVDYSRVDSSFPMKNFLFIDDFIAYVLEFDDVAVAVIQKKTDGIYTDVTAPLIIDNNCYHLSYLGKKDDNINFLIQTYDSFYILEENKKAYSLTNSESNFWNIIPLCSFTDAEVTTVENGLIFIKEYSFRDPSKKFHVYKYNKKIATISLTNEERQNRCFFGMAYACNNNGTLFVAEKNSGKMQSYLSFYEIKDDKIELAYTLNDEDVLFIADVQFSPCDNFIEVRYKGIINVIRKNIYSVANKEKCSESLNFPSAFNNTGFLYAECIEIEYKKMITIFGYENNKMQIKTVINCTNRILKVVFSPNSQLVAIIDVNSNGVKAIKVYQILKIQQDGVVKFLPTNAELTTEVFAEINIAEIIDFKFHPDGFKIIVITKKIIKIFCLSKIVLIPS